MIKSTTTAIITAVRILFVVGLDATQLLLKLPISKLKYSFEIIINNKEKQSKYPLMRQL